MERLNTLASGGGDGAPSYLVPCVLCWELPVEQVVRVQAETFVDQSVLRGTGGRRGVREQHHSERRNDKQADRKRKQASVVESSVD